MEVLALSLSSRHVVEHMICTMNVAMVTLIPVGKLSSRIVSYAEFLMQLSQQILTYDPRNNEYAGDNRLRVLVHNYAPGETYGR